MKGPRLPINFESSKTIEYNCCDWFDTDISSEFEEDDRKLGYYNRAHNKEFTIFSFGVTINGESVCCQIQQYHPYFYLLIPPEFNEKQIADLLYAFNTENTIELENSSNGQDMSDMERF